MGKKHKIQNLKKKNKTNMKKKKLEKFWNRGPATLAATLKRSHDFTEWNVVTIGRR